LAIVPSNDMRPSIGVNPRFDCASKPTGVPCWNDFELRKTGFATMSPEVDAFQSNEHHLAAVPGVVSSASRRTTDLWARAEAHTRDEVLTGVAPDRGGL
jgi:hypothetical protein